MKLTANDKNMTYKQLLEKLQTIPADRLDDTVTVWNVWEDEFTPVCGVTENGHIVLEVCVDAEPLITN